MAVEKRVASKCFGQVLKAVREESGESQQELAQKARLNRTFISFLERGLRQPTLFTIFALASALRLRATTVIDRVENCFIRSRRQAVKAKA